MFFFFIAENDLFTYPIKGVIKINNSKLLNASNFDKVTFKCLIKLLLLHILIY